MLEPRHRIPRCFPFWVLGVVSPQGSIIPGAKEMGSGPGHLQSEALAQAPGASFLSDGLKASSQRELSWEVT